MVPLEFMLSHTCLFKPRFNFSGRVWRLTEYGGLYQRSLLGTTLVCGTTQGPVLQTSTVYARDPLLPMRAFGSFTSFFCLWVGTHISYSVICFMQSLSSVQRLQRQAQNLGYVLCIYMTMIRRCINTFILTNLTSTHARKPAVNLDHMSSHGLLN